MPKSTKNLIWQFCLICWHMECFFINKSVKLNRILSTWAQKWPKYIGNYFKVKGFLQRPVSIQSFFSVDYSFCITLSVHTEIGNRNSMKHIALNAVFTRYLIQYPQKVAQWQCITVYLEYLHEHRTQLMLWVSTVVSRCFCPFVQLMRIVSRNDQYSLWALTTTHCYCSICNND